MRHLSPLPNVLIQLITQYLKSHKRLIIPQLGAFVVKHPGGDILFTEFLRRDDGVLRDLLREQGMSELEAAGVIDRFAFEVRHTLQQGGEYRMADFGNFTAGENSTLLFHHDAQLQQSPEELAQAAEIPDSSQKAVPYISPKVQPDPSLKGLRYGRPQKVSDHPFRGRRRIDRFLLVAIAAAILAVAAIAYGYIRSSQDDKAEDTASEQPQTPAETTPENTSTEQTQQ